jgi:hypothetical protein
MDRLTAFWEHPDGKNPGRGAVFSLFVAFPVFIASLCN